MSRAHRMSAVRTRLSVFSTTILVVTALALATASAPIAQASSSPFRFFGAGSIWNKVVSGAVPLDPASTEIVGALNRQIAESMAAGRGVNINTTSWSVPIYTVPARQPLVKVALNRTNALTSPLQAAWTAVPLPANASPAKGGDGQLVVWQPSTDRMWEFWAFARTATGPTARWGGAMANVSQSSGAYSPTAWLGASELWGASACSLPIVGGLITLEDLATGQINHALAMAVPSPRTGVSAWPAQRTDGTSTEPTSLPEGAHLRLDPTLNLASLHLPRLTLMLAEAAQRYGIVVRDKSSNVTFYAQDPTPTGSNPYIGASGYFEGKGAQQITASFPWSRLQLLKMELH